MELIAQTRYGAVRGTPGDDVSVFKGIPYAAPLDGERRFREPAPPERWDGVRDATSFTAPPPQSTLMPGMPSAWKPGDSTDCLSVNVWTPDPGGSGLPVVVWIYGGAYVLGSAAEPMYDGATLAAAGVVVVTFNYRVGYEGFGWLSDAPANRGFLDQLAALRWVHENIARFGGDPGNVTVFGESAGAGGVLTLTTARAARGLFRRAIAHSVPGRFFAEDEARRIGERITGELGVPATAEALARIPPEAIHRVQNAPLGKAATEPGSSIPEGITPYSPVLDGDLLPELPWHAMRQGAGRDIEFACGFNRDEYRLFTMGVDLSGRGPAEAVRMVGLPDSAVAEYRAAYPGASDTELYTTVFSDSIFRMPTTWCARAHAEAGGTTYLSELTWPTPVYGGMLGACHGLDLPLTFGIFDSPLGLLLLGESPPSGAEYLSAEMRTAWTSFATTGDPGWPAYRTDTALARIWDVPLDVAADPEAASQRIWQAHPSR
ncbi:para-nitrobenzyl esterase [Prauserella shujinwangii]|uniref:Carboxylic ester hydrolase n=1 Tax=Prauserella shujinwangii TaxID=1453103 RepID=A0A2T0LVM7_9PSEU|nr:carboxylesterase family protein [Prauserella shujinwangii]PRX47885.1 para-nitrobenzyl esterase [Prauserella shujinwangii]